MILFQLLNSKFVRNVAIVASGTAGAQAITMLFSPLITRIYGPEAFGLLGVFVALITILLPISALTYPTAIVLPQKDSDAKGIAKLSLILAFTVSILIAIIFWFTGEHILKLIGSEAISSYILFIPLAMLFAATLQVTEQWLIRKKHFKVTAKIAVMQSFIINSSKAGFGWLHPTGVVLIIITTIGAAIHALMMLIWIIKNPSKKTEDQYISKEKSISLLAREHKDFPLYRAPQLFVNAISQNLPVLILASFFGPIAAGFYALARLVLEVPSKLIGKSVADVFYPRINEASHNQEALNKLIAKATGALALVGLVPFSIIIIFGPALFSFVFGEEWDIAGEYAKWLALWLFSAFINRPSFVAIPVLNLQKEMFLFELFSLFARVSVLLLSYYISENEIAMIASFSLLNVFLNALLIISTIWLSSKNTNKREYHG